MKREAVACWGGAYEYGELRPDIVVKKNFQ
jgi:hypothetical protein